MRMGMFWKKSNGIVQINEKDSLRRSVLEIKTQRAYQYRVRQETSKQVFHTDI